MEEILNKGENYYFDNAIIIILIISQEENSDIKMRVLY